MKAKVTVTLKQGVLDPQGQAIENALFALGYEDVENVRQGKIIEFDLSETDVSKAKAEVTKMCEDLLANTVIETYSVELVT